ncbi:KH domain-containing protein [Bdellovibrio sp. HCB-110]|uniref:KH domain-containing protein n=1 Tax=Bdellovibrio sp. HCB-110 TaxID=3391182 RepID=UPI0039B57943
MSEAKVLQIIRRRVPVLQDQEETSNESRFNKLREDTRNLLEQVIKRMVNNPADIKVSFKVGERTTVYYVDCSKESLGRLIGAKGKNITGLRALLTAMMQFNGIRAIIEIPYYEPDKG